MTQGDFFNVDLFGIYPGIGRIDFAIPVGETEKSRNVHVYLVYLDFGQLL
ncbi:MAG: hypothetical protein AABY79_09515 [Nitrospirota bacterium]|jgi:hypothetical protein